jgi:hypothetical protein
MTYFPPLCRLSSTVAFIHHPYFDLFLDHRKSLELLRNLPKSHWANAHLKSNPNTSSLSTRSTSRPKLIPMCSAHPSSAAAGRRPKLPSPQLGRLPRLATHVAQPVHEPLAHSRENCLPFTNACSTENLPPLPDPLAVGLAIAGE